MESLITGHLVVIPARMYVPGIASANQTMNPNSLLFLKYLILVQGNGKKCQKNPFERYSRIHRSAALNGRECNAILNFYTPDDGLRMPQKVDGPQLGHPSIWHFVP